MLRPSLQRWGARGIVVLATERLAVLACCLAVAACGGGAGQGEGPQSRPQPADTSPTLADDEVVAIMQHAAQATDRQVAVAVVDRRGVILGVGTNFGFDVATLDGACAPGSDCAVVNLAVQLARTAAFFSADETPLTSRSVRFISDVHFPPGVDNTGAAALFGIENTNRGCSFDAALGAGLFNAGKLVPRALSLSSALREQQGLPPLRCENADDAEARRGCTTGIATVPGAVPIFKGNVVAGGRMAGGVGVALRGTTLVPDPIASTDAPDVILRKSDDDPNFAVAEFAARAFAGDKTGFPRIAKRGLEGLCASTTIARPACCASDPQCFFGILPATQLPFDPVIFIDGIEVPEIASNPPVDDVGDFTPTGIVTFVVDPLDPTVPAAAPVPGGYLVGPLAASDAPPGAAPLSQAEVDDIVQTAFASALRTRAAIRLPLQQRTAMMLAVSDTEGNLLAVFRMDDATVFSIDVAVAKSQNVIYFSSPDIDPLDTLDSPGVADTRGEAFPPGTAITNRTLSFGAQPFFPSGIDGSDPGPFRRVFIDDSRVPCTNGKQPTNGRQSGIVFFPGSAPLYRDGVLVGGFGVSGDGVEQDDIVSAAGMRAGPNFEPEARIRADQLSVRGVRLPYLKFNRQPNQ
jgi:uncharacterized protein GlcG (DUF336 family)